MVVHDSQISSYYTALFLNRSELTRFVAAWSPSPGNRGSSREVKAEDNISYCSASSSGSTTTEIQCSWLLLAEPLDTLEQIPGKASFARRR